jgi:hypothetical protein
MDRLEEEFQRLDEEGRSAYQAGTEGFLMAGARWAEMSTSGCFSAGGIPSMKAYYEGIGVNPSFGKRLENAGKWLIENKIKPAALKDVTLSKVETISGMKNPEVWIEKAKNNTLEELKNEVIEKRHGVEVVSKLPPPGGRCVNCEGGMCAYGHNTRQKKIDDLI